MPPQAAQYDLSAAFLDIPKTIAYGLVRGAGNLILQQELTDKSRVAYYMLGEGPWDSIVRLWVNNLLVALPNTSIAHFHPGGDGEIGNGLSAVSTGGDQHVDAFFTLIPGGLVPITFSRYAWLALHIAADPGAPTAQLTVLADYQATQVRQFDSSGNQTAFAWTQNWAWIICDFLIRKFILREGKVNQPLLAAELGRFDWPSFVAAAAYYDGVLSLGQKRFSDGGVVFLRDGDTAAKALDQLLMMCQSYLLERNGKLSLYGDRPRASIFTFTSDNVQPLTFKCYKTNLRATTNRLAPTYRDLNIASGSSDDATRFAISSSPLANHEAHQRAVGARGPGLSVIPKVTELSVDLGVNTPERVGRILNGILIRQLGDDVDANTPYVAPFSVQLTAFEDSMAVEPGDVCRVDRSVGEEAGSAPPRSNSTRIQTSGGTSTAKYYFDAGVAAPGQAYELQVSITNNGPNVLQLQNNLVGGAQNIQVGETRFVVLAGVGTGSNLFFAFYTVNVGDSIDCVARDPVLRRAGFSENLITVGLDFTGWIAYLGAAVTLTQGAQLGVDPFLFEVMEVDEKPDGTRDVIGLEYMPNAFPAGAAAGQALLAPAPGTGIPVPAGPANFSYSPLTNALTATDAGSNAAVNVAAFTMRYAGLDVSVSPGSLGSLSYNTTYYIYYDDLGRAGGGVTFVPTTTKGTALNGAGRCFVGSITTPRSGGLDTIGNNDGGAGAQVGFAANLYAASSVFDGSGGGVIANQSNATDGDTGTHATLTSSSGPATTGIFIVSGMNGIAPYYGSLVLNVRTAVGGAADGRNKLEYSLNGGATWTTIYNIIGTRALATDTVTLPASQNISGVWVKATCSSWLTTSANIAFYEAWIAASG